MRVRGVRGAQGVSDLGLGGLEFRAEGIEEKSLGCVALRGFRGLRDFRGVSAFRGFKRV